MGPSPFVRSFFIPHIRSWFSNKPTGVTIYILRKVDDFALACFNEFVADDICNQIGENLQLPGKSDKPFSYLGLIIHFNGIDIDKSRDYIQISCHNYINRVMRSQNWNENKSKLPDKPPSCFPPDSLKKLFSHSVPK